MFCLLLFMSVPVGVIAQKTEKYAVYEYLVGENIPAMVRIRNNLYMCETEVTNAEYRAYLTGLLKSNGTDELYRKALPDTLVWKAPLAYNDPYINYYFRHPSYDDYPVVGVAPMQVKEFCNWQAKQIMNLIKVEENMNDVNVVCRLPTEEEWEFAAQAGNMDAVLPWEGTTFYDKNGTERANFRIDCKPITLDTKEQITTSVYKYAPNDFGLYSMAGNVAEMVFCNDTDKQTDMKYHKEQIILKGGSWCQASFFAIIKTQHDYWYTDKYIGFRYVCEIKQ